MIQFPTDKLMVSYRETILFLPTSHQFVGSDSGQMEFDL